MQGSVMSSFVSATAGVPQGAVLSPLLFVVYINDLANSCMLRMMIAMFADDVAAWPDVITMNVKSQYSVMRSFLVFVSQWSEIWKLEFSINKTKLIDFTHKRYLYEPKPPLVLCGSVLTQDDVMKYLGVGYNQDGSNDAHFDDVFRKARQTALHA